MNSTKNCTAMFFKALITFIFFLSFQLLTLAVLSIVITAPIGAIAIALGGPKLLQKSTGESDSGITEDHPSASGSRRDIEAGKEEETEQPKSQGKAEEMDKEKRKMSGDNGTSESKTAGPEGDGSEKWEQGTDV